MSCYNDRVTEFWHDMSRVAANNTTLTDNCWMHVCIYVYVLYHHYYSYYCAHRTTTPLPTPNQNLGWCSAEPVHGMNVHKAQLLWTPLCIKSIYTKCQHHYYLCFGHPLSYVLRNILPPQQAPQVLLSLICRCPPEIENHDVIDNYIYWSQGRDGEW